MNINAKINSPFILTVSIASNYAHSAEVMCVRWKSCQTTVTFCLYSGNKSVKSLWFCPVGSRRTTIDSNSCVRDPPYFSTCNKDISLFSRVFQIGENVKIILITRWMTSIISTASWQPFGLFCHIFLSSRIRILRNKSDIGHKALQDFFFFHI